MASNELRPALKPDVSTRQLPLPLLLPALRTLSLPVQDLYAEIARDLEENLFVTISGDSMPLSRSPRVAWESLGDADYYENLPHVPSMDEDVKAQLGLLPASDALPGYVKDLLVQALGEDGYLREEAVETVRAAAGFSTREVRSLIREIQDAVDPPGLFAKDLVDCLLIQLRRLGLEESDPSILLREGAAFLEKGDFQSLGKHLGWSGQRVEAALSKIRRLDPKPGRIFCPVRPVVPEISFSEGGKGIQVRYLHEYLPRIQIERDLAGLRDRYTDQWDSVKGALKTLSMRAKTKLRLALFLAEIQRPFLLGEVSAPGPVTLEAIAAGTGYHASTVQRVLASTWATTPRGTIALSEAVSRPLASRTEMSVAQLRQAIKGAVAAGMTDRTIAESLGIPRRTITWHRSAVR